jgi:hypothetical protein
LDDAGHVLGDGREGAGEGGGGGRHLLGSEIQPAKFTNLQYYYSQRLIEIHTIDIDSNYLDIYFLKLARVC